MAHPVSAAWFSRPRAAATRMAAPLPRHAPVWPTVSIVVLLVFSALLKPIVLTVMNATLVGLSLLVVLVANRPVDRRLLAVTVPFLLIVFIGMATGLASDRYDYLKDGWYILNPPLIIATGYVLFVHKPDLARGLRAFVVGGLLVALWQLRPYLLYPDIVWLPATTIRRIVGTGYYAPVLALLILLLFAGQWRSGLRLPRWLAAAALLLAALSVAGVFSRTALVIVVVGVAARLGCFARREWLRLGLPVLLLLGAALAVQPYVDDAPDRVLNSFGGKLARAFEELTVSENADLREINTNFRGYETARALAQYADGSPLQLSFGRGLGATVDLGIYLPLGSNDFGTPETMRFITLLHNGYAFLLTKAGAAGVLLYLGALGFLYRLGRRHAAGAPADAATRAGRLLQAGVVSLAITTYIIGGVFNKLDMFPFLLITGFLLASLTQRDG